MTPTGRRRSSAPACCPEWAVAHSPGRDPDAVGQAWPGQPRAALAAADVLRTADGRWLVRAGPPARCRAGLGYALAIRAALAPPCPALFAAGAARPTPRTPCALLRAGLAAAASPGLRGHPAVAVLSAGPT